jgi:hypothetical protein
MKTIEEWYELLTEMTKNTEYSVIMKKGISSPVVAIVPKWTDTPQRIAIYPKQRKNAGLVIENDIFNLSKIRALIGDPTRIHGNRPHYNDVPSHIIIEVCKIFLHGV